MKVVKRNGRCDPVQFDKIAARLRKLSYELDTRHVDIGMLSQKVIGGLYNNMAVSEIDEYAAQEAAMLSTRHTDYSVLAARISVSNLHKETDKSFSRVCEVLHGHHFAGRHAPLVSDAVMAVAKTHMESIHARIIYDRDFNYNYFGFKTLERSYLLRVGGKVVERPQHMMMRVALGIHGDDLEAAFETYDHMSCGMFIHATPTLFNAGTPTPQMSSCFLVSLADDSIDGIFQTVRKCALISRGAGGIGVSVSRVRSKGSYIHGSGGKSNGLVPMLRVFDATARYVDQGGGKRRGAIAIYIEPWHADMLELLELKKNHGKEELRARDLFYALWIPDLFMTRVQEDGEWSLFCPNECPLLWDTWGDEFEEEYARCEAKGFARDTIRARDLWGRILASQMETGGPYMLYKDACNGKSNQKNLGTIRCSNLCTEIVQYTSAEEHAVCNLASVALPKFVRADERNGVYDLDALVKVVGIVVRNLNRVIDRNSYPTEEARRSNQRHRPIGIGVQGLADVFAKLRLPFTSDDAKALNRQIFEAIYFGAVSASCELAQRDGPYDTYEGSPMSRGQLQFDMWGVAPSDRWDWDALRGRIAAHGVRNSLLVAPMPTASTAQILGNTECFEPITSNVYSRRVLAGDFFVINAYLMQDLGALGLWDEAMRETIIRNGGSIQAIESIPGDVRELYKTCWELSMRDLIDMAAERAPFIDQSQSLNLFVSEPSVKVLSSMHFYAWKRGLKTGMYYLRTRSAVDAVKFSIAPTAPTKDATQAPLTDPDVCQRGCDSCSA